MKWYRWMLVGLMALLVISCAEDPVIDNDRIRMSFNASYENDDTRTVLVDRVKVYWQDGDRIAVSGATEAFGTSLTEDSPTAVFDGEAPQADMYYAVYPYEAVKEMAGEAALLHLEDVQPAVKGTFASGINISVAYASDDTRNFHFRNVLGYMKFSVGPGTGRITSITVAANSGEALAGDFYVDCSSDAPEVLPDAELTTVSLTSEEVLSEGDYYIAVLPGTYESGLTFTFEGPDGKAVKKVEKPLELERGHINSVNISTLDWQAEEVFYVKVTESYDDWSGDYLITYSTATAVKIFDSWDGESKGLSTVNISSSLTEKGIPAEVADPYKAVIAKVGGYYSVNIAGVGYIGLESSSNKVNVSSAVPSSSNTEYLWTPSYKNGGLWLINASYTGRRLQWNSDAGCFRCYTGGQKEITLYRRTVSTGSGTVTPEPENPDPEIPEEPDDPQNPDDPEDPDPVIPDPVPGISGKYSWYELPAISYVQSGDYLVDSSDDNLYYAHHICAGNETGPGGKKARNYTVCFSAEHHCPVWVAAPRHKMYESGASRTDSYAKDPSIPADIQYNSKSTGGGCNKGHMLGSAERLSSTATNRQVFYYSNIAPQYSDSFNTGGGGWNILEDWVDGKVCSDTLYVVIGAYFDTFTDGRGNTGRPATISFGGRNDVSRPTMFYYILLRTKKGSTGKPLSKCTKDELMCAAFVRSHETPKGTSVSEEDLMSVSELEEITGFTYFPNVPQAPKESYKASDWGL